MPLTFKGYSIRIIRWFAADGNEPPCGLTGSLSVRSVTPPVQRSPDLEHAELGLEAP
jgi:hypothetical protein